MDFLKKFVSDGGVSEGRCCLKQEPVDDEENVELSLGLSLNGRFGVERRRLVGNSDKLVRASSVVNLPLVTEDETTLTRTYSLPIAAEEWWKRKELFSLRRSEAKRKRVEKLKNGKLVVKENGEMKRRKGIHENEVLPPLPRLSSGGSPASGGSSGVYDLETQPFSGLHKDIESKNTASQQSTLYQVSRSTPSRSTSLASEKSSVNENHWKDETLKMMLSDMPCVSTKENGVDGKKIEGFLYRYRKGEEVRIVCVCHGSFLTPAEFVKHGGGGDVEHPLRHIVVNPPSL